MAVNLVVNGVTYAYPTVNSNSWGSNATAWAVAITDAVNSVAVPGDIGPTTSVQIQNDGALHDVTDCIVDNTVTRGAEILYDVYRIKGSNEKAEVGTMRVVYKTNANTWELINSFGGEANIVFTITTGGQVQYTATVMDDVGSYTGNMRFRVRALPL